MAKYDGSNVYKILSQVEEELYKKAEEIIDSLTDEERGQLESVGWVLELEDVVELITEYLGDHFTTQNFSVGHVKNDLKDIDKKVLFEL